MTAEPTAALVPIGDTDPQTLPSPDLLCGWLAKLIEDGIVRMRRERGQVHQPEDTYALVRALTRADDVLSDMESAISSVRTRIRGALEEELVEAVGEQDGIPSGSVSVPVDGTVVKIGAKYENRYDIDTGQVVGAIVAALADEWGDQATADPAQFALAAVEQVIDPDSGILGKVSAKPTKVRALVAALAARELDPLAAVARSAIGQPVRTYKGVDVQRSQAS